MFFLFLIQSNIALNAFFWFTRKYDLDAFGGDVQFFTINWPKEPFK